MSLEALHRALTSEPGTLRGLEGLLGFSLARDPAGEEAWLLRRKHPQPGLAFVYAAFSGWELHDVADPRVDELRLEVPGADTHAIATQILGPPEVVYERVSDPSQADDPPKKLFWPRRQGTFTTSGAWLFWSRHEPAFRDQRSPEEETSFLQRLAALLGGPIDEGRIRYAYGPPMTSGSFPDRFVRDFTWKLTIRPVVGPPKSLQLKLSPEMPAARLLTALGLPPALVSTQGVHQESACLVNASTHRAFVVNGNRVELGVESFSHLTRSPVLIPAHRAYEVDGATVSSIRIDPAKS